MKTINLNINRINSTISNGSSLFCGTTFNGRNGNIGFYLDEEDWG